MRGMVVTSAAAASRAEIPSRTSGSVPSSPAVPASGFAHPSRKRARQLVLTRCRVGREHGLGDAATPGLGGEGLVALFEVVGERRVQQLAHLVDEG